jgi:quinoprotein glucose dehydrogenase
LKHTDWNERLRISGKILWRFGPHVGMRAIGKMRSRGVTYWSDGIEKRVFVAVRQYFYFLDAQTGELGDFGDAGRIDLRDNLGREPKNWVTMTSRLVLSNY